DAGLQVRWSVSRSNHHHALDSGSQGPIDNSVPVGVKLGVVEMAMRVDHLRRAPIGTSSRKLASTGLPPSCDSATMMPCDSRPRNLRGARLATITTLRPTRASGL